MKQFRMLILAGLVLGLVVLPMTALADSISPDSFSATLDVGESVTVRKTVTVTEEPPTTNPVDVFFLTDSTGSMFGEIAAVKASASAILSSTAGLGDLRWGVGEYKDVGDTFVYRTNQDLTDNQTDVQTGIDEWSASGGGDFREANLYALEEVAETASWRTGSEKILVWFGDAPGKDPAGPGGVSTEASATAALVAEGIQVEAVDVGLLNQTGQALRIANATGGTYYSGVSTGDLVNTIIDAITSAVLEYDTVSIDTSDAPAGVGVAVSPAAIVGDFDRSVTRTFDFDVTFTGLAAGDYSFDLYATVDGARVATESDRISVGVPEPGTMMLLGLGLLGLAGVRRRIK